MAGVNKVVFGSDTLIDLTADTVVASALVSGYTAHNQAGDRITGTAIVDGMVEIIDFNSSYNINSSKQYASVLVKLGTAEESVMNKTIISYSNSDVTQIGSYAFAYCSSLTTISFPNVTSIGSLAFYYCSALTTASFPEATIIGNGAFYSCYSLTTISFPSATTIGEYAFQDCSSLITASFPSATTIGSYAFQSCWKLSTVRLSQVSYIGPQAFRYCSSLTSFYLDCSSIPTLAASVFLNTPLSVSSLTGTFGTIYVRSSLFTQYKTATNWKSYSARMVSM